MTSNATPGNLLQPPDLRQEVLVFPCSLCEEEQGQRAEVKVEVHTLTAGVCRHLHPVLGPPITRHVRCLALGSGWVARQLDKVSALSCTRGRRNEGLGLTFTCAGVGPGGAADARARAAEAAMKRFEQVVPAPHSYMIHLRQARLHLPRRKRLMRKRMDSPGTLTCCLSSRIRRRQRAFQNRQQTN